MATYYVQIASPSGVAKDSHFGRFRELTPGEVAELDQIEAAEEPALTAYPLRTRTLDTPHLCQRKAGNMRAFYRGARI